MNADNNLLPINSEEYESVLQHAVAVIEDARIRIAKHINSNVSSAYWEFIARTKNIKRIRRQNSK